MFQPHKMSDFLILKKLVSTRNDVLRTSPVIPYWWCISITTQTWVVLRHHYGISALVSQKKTNKQTNKQKQEKKTTKLKKEKKNGKQVVTSRRFPLRLISTEHFMFYRMHLLTVAGEATARSWTSNNMCMVLLSLILSLLAKQSILLSSKTVFMFSIHRASTGPSHTIHLWSSVVSWGETIKNGHNKRQPEADVLHSWAVILNIYLGKSS